MRITRCALARHPASVAPSVHALSPPRPAPVPASSRARAHTATTATVPAAPVPPPHPARKAPPPLPRGAVIDAGFSSTHTVPIFGGAPLNFGTTRLNVGGKMLTNQLKQLVSFRAFNVMDETHMINDVKERLCYLSLDFDADLTLSRFKGRKNTLRREFIMPDYVKHFRGQIRDPNEAPAPASANGGAAGGGAREGGPPPKKKAKEAGGSDEQVLNLSNERITVPEILFHPSDIGIEQAGVHECAVQSAEACVPDLREALYSNVVLTGGSSLFPNFVPRLEAELRRVAPADCPIGVTHATDPLLAAWRGGSIFASSDAYPKHVVTREEYREEGHALCRRRFLA